MPEYPFAMAVATLVLAGAFTAMNRLMATFALPRTATAFLVHFWSCQYGFGVERQHRPQHDDAARMHERGEAQRARHGIGIGAHSAVIHDVLTCGRS